MEKQTATQRFIETAVALWEASGKLANVASSTSNDYGRRATYKLMNKLDDTLKQLVLEWNSELFEGEQAIIECASSLAGNKGCEIFTADADSEGRCPKCAERENGRR